MESKIMQVYYDNDCLPYKDIGRSVHYPIVGSAFNGANNTTQIRFFVDMIGGVDNVSWVVIAKLPNGKIQYQLLDSDNHGTEDNENYLSFDLSSYYTQYKGDIYISLNGYQGQVNVVEDEDTGIYTIVGTPTIQATGSIKLSINYAPQLPQGNTFGFSDYQLIAGALSNKTNIGNSIFVLDNIEIADLSGYRVGQYFYDRKTQQYYEKTDSGYELADDKSGILGKKYIDDKVDFIFDVVDEIADMIVNEHTLVTKSGVVSDNTITLQGVVSDHTLTLTTTYIFYSKEEIDTILLDYVTNSSLAATLSDYYTKTQVDTILTTKVDKTSSGYKIYATDEQGNQTTLPYDEDTDGKVVRRDESGHVYVQNPNANGQATPKQYVDVFAKSLTASIDTSTYVMTLTLKDNLGNTLSTQTIDLPLETMVVSGSYDDENEEIVLELKNGQTISIPVGDLVSGLVSTSDLATELANYVDLTSTQTITGTKTFKGDLKFVGASYTTEGVLTTDNSYAYIGFGGANTLFAFNGSRFLSNNVNGTDLGSSTRLWKDLYLSGNINTLLASDQDISDIMGD